MLATASGEKFFEKDDKSEAKRLQMLYVGSKHMDSVIAGGKIPTEATVAVWITNHGLESSRATLSFDELLEMLLNMGRLAERLSKLEPTTATPFAELGRAGSRCRLVR